MLKNRPLKIAVIAFTLVAVWMVGTCIKFLTTPLITNPLGTHYTVQEGASINSVIEDLHQRQLLKHTFWFKLLVKYKGVANELKAGEYHFPPGSTPSMLLHQLVTGSGMVYHSFTIVPGWSYGELRKALNQNTYLHHTLQNLTDAEVMREIGSAKLNPEGQFFPDTYYFAENSDDLVVLKRAFTAMQKKLDNAWQKRETGLPFKNPYEALIAASIIEKEAYFKEDLPKMAGVLINRLKKGMLLQFDPTVLYAAGGRPDRKIYQSDLQDKNPYNTYLNKGLPPTPISMPGLAAIKAVLHPAHHDYLYFVSQANGTTIFTKKLTDHNNVVAYIRKNKWNFNFKLARIYLKQYFSPSLSNADDNNSQQIKLMVPEKFRYSLNTG